VNLTTGLVSKVSDQLASEIESLVSKNGIVVWYDEAEVFSEIFDHLNIENVKKVRFTGSFLEVRWKIEEADPDLKGCWIIYVPRPREECNWLREFELIGSVFQPEFSEILKRRYRLTFGKDEEKLLKGTLPMLLKLIEKRPEEIRKEDLGSYSHLLNLILTGVFDEPKYDIDTIVLKYLQDPKLYAANIASLNLQEQFLAKIKDEYGIKSNGLEELRYDVARAILFSDFYEGKQDKTSFRFANLLPEKSKIRLCASLAEKWRQHGAYKQRYIEFANRIEKDYDIEDDICTTEDIIKVQTFKKIDELALNLLIEELSKVTVTQTPNLCHRLLTFSSERKEMFWTKEGYLSFWEAVSFGAKVIESASMISTKLSPTFDAERIIKAYVEELWQTDYHYRKFTECFKVEGPIIDELRIRVNHFYETFVEILNRAFSSSLENVKEWSIEGTMRQDHFWREAVSPLSDGPAAIFMVDALRLDLGKELADRLREDYNVELRTTLAIPPTITEVGMAAILPTESVLTFFNKNGKFMVGYESEFKNKDDRIDWLKRHIDHSTVLNITDVLRSDVKDLEKTIRGKNRIIVTSRDIDSMGENLEAISLGVFSEVLNDLDNSIRRLSRAGIEHFLITADHGFLYTKVREESDKLDPPKGEVLFKSKRFAVGHNLNAGSYHIITTESLGVRGGFEIAFPRGIACFKHPGGEEYVHGGLSLQEILIPCIRLENRVKIESKKLRVTVDFPERITNLIFNITLKPAGQLLLGQEGREIEVIVTANDVAVTEPIRKIITTEPVRVIVKLKAGQLSPKSKHILISIRDASSKEVLQSKQVPLDIVYDDLGI
jgi:hypothetical protein